ncbi:MAG: DUF58 domain-containing protein [Acidobacteria bacterium]|nr:DUF58 domain-containing protein [Acidobacteriota bacterium]
MRGWLSRFGFVLQKGVARLWRRFFRPWLRPLHGAFPLTRTGVAFLLLFGLAVWFQGVLHLDLVLLVAGLAGILVIASLLLCTLAGATWLTWRSRRARTPGLLDLETATPQPTGYRVGYPRWIPFTVAQWQWVNDGNGETAAAITLERERGELVEMAAPERRCIVERVVRRFAVRDLFGLCEIAWRRAETVSLRVLPERGMLAQMPPPAGMADGDDLSDVYAEPRGDRVEMRQYAPGDPLRMVLWKVYARTNRMMVRTPERSVAERRKGCAYLVASPNDDATAAVARIAIERGLLGDDWCFAADGVDRHATEREEALEVLARSGEAETAERDGNLGAFLSKMENEGYQFCILLLPPDPQAWAHAATQVTGTGILRMQILTGVEAVRPEREGAPAWKARLSRWFLRPDGSPQYTLEDLRQLASGTAGMAATAGVAERQTGHLFQDILGGRGYSEAGAT